MGDWRVTEAETRERGRLLMHQLDITRSTELLETSLLTPEDLPQTLAAVGRDLGWDHFCLVHSELESPTFIAAESTLEGLNAYYAGGWLEVDYRAANVNLGVPGQLFLEKFVVPEEQRVKSEIYNELYIPQRMANFVCWRHEIAGSTWIFSLARSADKGPANDTDVDALTRLAPYANRTLQMARQIREVRVQGMLDGLYSADVAAIIIDSDGKARSATPQAEAMFDSNFGVRGDQLWASNRDLQIKLDGITACARAKILSGGIENVVVRRSDGLRPILIQSMPVRGMGLDVLPGARVLLTLTDLGGTRPSTATDLRALFDLSKAEADIAALVGAGLDPNEIARRRGVGIETVRAQLKSVFRKLEVNRQSDLVLLLGRINSTRPKA